MVVARKEMYTYTNKYVEKNKVKKQITKKHKNISAKVRLFCCVTIFFSVCLLVLLSQAYISQMNYDILELDNEIVELQKQKQDLVLETEKIKASGRIEKIAIEELGMQYPSEEQVVYISVGDGESFEEEVAETTQKDYLFLKAFSNTFDKLFNLMSQ